MKLGSIPRAINRRNISYARGRSRQAFETALIEGIDPYSDQDPKAITDKQSRFIEFLFDIDIKMGIKYEDGLYRKSLYKLLK